MAALSVLEASDARDTLALGRGRGHGLAGAGRMDERGAAGGAGAGAALAGASGEVTLVSRRGHAMGLMFGGLTAFALAAIAVVGAIEAYQLFELLTRLEQVPLAERAQLLVRTTDEVARLQPVRWGSMGLIVALVLASVWKSRRGAQAERGGAESAILLAAIAALLVLDGHPLRSALQGARSVGLAPVLLPEGFQPLRTARADEPPPLMARATPEGITLAGGLQLPWSIPARTLAGTFALALHPANTGAAAPVGITPVPQLSLLADARLSGPALQRLIEASTQAGVHSVQLVGHLPNAAEPPVMARLEQHFPFFSLLAARPGTLRLLLPSALPGATAPSWTARFAGEALHLSPAQGGDSLTLSLHATPAEVPDVLAGTFVGLELSGDVSLQQLGAAVEVLGLAGASPVVMLGSGMRRAPSSHSGTRTLQSAARRGVSTPELLHRVVEAQLHALKSLRRGESSRRPALAFRASMLTASAAQSSQMNSATPTMNPTPSTSIMKNPSRLDDWGTFGTASGPEGFTSPAGTASALVGRSPEWVTTEDSRSSSPSRASASTRFMWSM